MFDWVLIASGKLVDNLLKCVWRNSLEKAACIFNDTQKENLVRYWIQYKNSLKYKVGCFWRFSYVYTIN